MSNTHPQVDRLTLEADFFDRIRRRLKDSGINDEFDAPLSALQERLVRGAQEYGDASFFEADCTKEVLEEMIDVAGWLFIRFAQVSLHWDKAAGSTKGRAAVREAFLSFITNEAVNALVLWKELEAKYKTVDQGIAHFGITPGSKAPDTPPQPPEDPQPNQE